MPEETKEPTTDKKRVDFEYVVDGQKYAFSMAGGDSIDVGELLEKIGVCDAAERDSFVEQIENVEFSDPELVEVVHTTPVLGVFGKETWVLKSLQPFNTEETLTITMKDGQVFTINVTDLSYLMRDAVTSATADGLNGDTWAVRTDVDYTIHLTFEESTGNVQFADSDTLTYSLPSGFKPTGTITGQEFELSYTQGGVPGTLTGCTYDVDANGNITIHLTPKAKEIINSAADAKLNIDITGRIQNNTTELDFGGGQKKTIEIDNTHEVTVKKSGSYQSGDNKVHYSLNINSKGENNSVYVEDEILGSALHLDANSVVVKNSKGEVVTPTVNYNGDKFNLTIPKMNHNETYTVEYTATVDWNTIGSGKGTYDQTNNTASVKSTEDSDPDTDSNDLENRIDYNPLSKSHGSVPTDGSDTKTIPWTITVNADFIKNMKGTTITDKNGSPAVMQYSGSGIAIEKYDKNGNKVGETVYKSWNDLNIDPTSATSWSYTIPDDGNYKYIISYTTDVDVTGQNGSIQVKNDTDDGHGHKSSDQADVKPGSSAISAEKKNTGVTTEDMSWSVTMTVPATGLNKAVLIDTLPTTNAGKGYQDTLDVGSLKVSGLQGGESYALTQSDGKFTLTFYKDAEQTEPGLTKIADSGTRDIVVTFKTITDEKWIEDRREDGHVNNIEFQGDNASVYDSDQGLVPQKTLDKLYKGTYTFTDESGNKLIGYKYAIDLYGVEDTDFTNNILSVTDTYDSKYLRLWDLNIEGKEPTGGNGWWEQIIQNGNNGGNDNPGNADQKNKYKIAENNGILTFTFKNTGSNATDPNVLPREQDGSYYKRYQVTYYLVVKDATTMTQLLNDSLAQEDRTIDIENKAKWGDFEDKVTVDYGYNALTKTNVKPSTKTGTDSDVYDSVHGTTGFTIEINPEAMTLNEGKNMTLTDTFSETLSIDYSTIKIYDITTNPDTGKEIKTLRTDIQYDYKGNVGTYSIPDSTHFIIEYDAKLVGKPGANVHYENKVEMSGFKDEAGGDKQIAGTGDASANIYSVKLYKYAAGHMETPIPGTVFTLVDADGNPVVYPNHAYDESKRGLPITFTTGANGYVNIELSEGTDGISLQKGITYYLKETTSDPNYAINNTTYRFTISDNPDYSKYEYHSGDILKVYDWPVMGQIEIEKSIEGGPTNLTEEDKEKITFEITGTYPGGGVIKVDDMGYTVAKDKANSDMKDFKLKISYAEFASGKYIMQDLVDGT